MCIHTHKISFLVIQGWYNIAGSQFLYHSSKVTFYTLYYRVMLKEKVRGEVADMIMNIITIQRIKLCVVFPANGVGQVPSRHS